MVELVLTPTDCKSDEQVIFAQKFAAFYLFATLDLNQRGVQRFKLVARKMEAQRIQRKRTRGWKMPENTVSVCRPTKYGNPLKINGDYIMIDAGYRRFILSKWVILCKGDLNLMLRIYESILRKNRVLLASLIFENGHQDIWHWVNKIQELSIVELANKNLACFCNLNNPCHADILLKIANE